MISLALLCLYIVKVQIFMLLMDLTLKSFKEIYVVFESIVSYCVWIL
jgi:hypothetical protein